MQAPPCGAASRARAAAGIGPCLEVPCRRTHDCKSKEKFVRSLGSGRATSGQHRVRAASRAAATSAAFDGATSGVSAVGRLPHLNKCSRVLGASSCKSAGCSHGIVSAFLQARAQHQDVVERRIGALPKVWLHLHGAMSSCTLSVGRMRRPTTNV
eukprot:scaffold176089_cov28-Tisochrysis_lutea.AAC.2